MSRTYRAFQFYYRHLEVPFLFGATLLAALGLIYLLVTWGQP
jgi:hypothetical protein